MENVFAVFMAQTIANLAAARSAEPRLRHPRASTC